MGNADSIPVVSQVKSMVQSASGDNEGALKTQENFIRTGIIASQINSAVVAAQGDHAEALKIQEEFGAESIIILEGLPLVGHAMSAGYAAGGDLAKAEEVALTATKSTVVAGSALVGLACGPGAPACSAALGSAAVVGTSAAWDGVESLVRNETVGVVNTFHVVKDMVEANDTVDAGEVFDIAFEQTALAAGGAFGGFKLGKAGGRMVKGGGRVAKGGSRAGAVARSGIRCPCKREVRQGVDVNPMLTDLPPSLQEIDLQTQSVDSLVEGVLSVFLILKLVFGKSPLATPYLKSPLATPYLKSPLATPYLKEICHGANMDGDLDECHQKLIMAMQKYSSIEEEENGQPGPMVSSLSTLAFAYDNMVAENVVGSGLELWLCSSVPEAQSDPGLEESCVLRLKEGMREIEVSMETQDNSGHARTKRSAMCCASRNFRKNHLAAGGDVAGRNRLGKNTRILTGKQKVYGKVAGKLAKGEWQLLEHQGKVQRVVTLDGLNMVDEVKGKGGKMAKVAREGSVRVAVSEQGQIVHLLAAAPA